MDRALMAVGPAGFLVAAFFLFRSGEVVALAWVLLACAAVSGVGIIFSQRSRRLPR